MLILSGAILRHKAENIWSKNFWVIPLVLTRMEDQMGFVQCWVLRLCIPQSILFCKFNAEVLWIFCSLASFVEETSHSRFTFQYFISIQRCFGYKYTITGWGVILLPLPLRCHCWSWNVQVFLGWETSSSRSLGFCIHKRKTGRLSS